MNKSHHTNAEQIQHVRLEVMNILNVVASLAQIVRTESEMIGTLCRANDQVILEHAHRQGKLTESKMLMQVVQGEQAVWSEQDAELDRLRNREHWLVARETVNTLLRRNADGSEEVYHYRYLSLERPVKADAPEHIADVAQEYLERAAPRITDSVLADAADAYVAQLDREIRDSVQSFFASSQQTVQPYRQLTASNKGN